MNPAVMFRNVYLMESLSFNKRVPCVCKIEHLNCWVTNISYYKPRVELQTVVVVVELI